MAKAAKKPDKPILDVSKNRKGELKNLGGSMSNGWNQVICDQVGNSLTPRDDEEHRDEAWIAALQAMNGIAPKDELEGMLAAQLVASHSASMDCYRRAMTRRRLSGGGNILTRRTSSRGPTQRCSKASTDTAARDSKRSRSSTFTSTRAAKPSSATSRARGVGSHRNQRNNPMHLDMHQAKRCRARTRRGSRVSRRQCRTGAAGCTAERLRAHRRGIRTPSSTGAIRQRRLHAAGQSQS